MHLVGFAIEIAFPSFSLFFILQIILGTFLLGAHQINLTILELQWSTKNVNLPIAHFFVTHPLWLIKSERFILFKFFHTS